MNGLDPAGMHEIRDMILSLVAEGRTVVLSSHLLDEVERTCDAVAIVDRGNVIRQGPISELLAGASIALQVECSEPDRARCPPRRHQHRGTHRSRARSGSGSRCRQGRPATSSPRSTASSSKVGSPSTGSSRSKPRSSRGSCRSRADWGPRNDDSARGQRPPSPIPPSAPTGAPRDHRGSPIPTWRHDRHEVHGAAQAAWAHDRPDPGEHRHPDHLPHRPTAGPRLRPEVLRPGRRLRASTPASWPV